MQRTRISCQATLDKGSVCPFFDGKAHEAFGTHYAQEEIRVSEMKVHAVLCTGHRIFNESGTLPFVIPSEAEGSAVLQAPR